MHHAEQVRLLKILMHQLDTDTNVDAGGLRQNPSWAYTSADLAKKEWDQFFRKHPQVIGMSADLPENDSFMTVNDFGLPLLATRDSQGTFRAFANVCRHRNTIVEQEKCGKKKNFSCPFHAWTYSSSGELVGVPKAAHFGAIDRSRFGLVEYPAVEKYGVLWVHPEQEAALDVDALLTEELAAEFDSWNFGDLTLMGTDTFEMPLNWKLAVDTFGETYHFTALHRNTLAMSFYGNVQGYDTYGRNHRMTLCKKDIDELRRRPESEWDVTVGANPNYYLFPNVQVNVGPRGIAITVRTYPDPTNVARSISRIGFYAPTEVAAMAAEPLREGMQFFANVIRDEDYVAAASSQVGANSGATEFVTFGRNEPALHHYHNTYREALGMELLPLIEG